MDKVISIRTNEDVHRDLKLLAVLKEMSVGDLLEALVREEFARMNRGARVADLGNEGEKRVMKQDRKKKRGF